MVNYMEHHGTLNTMHRFSEFSDNMTRCPREGNREVIFCAFRLWPGEVTLLLVVCFSDLKSGANCRYIFQFHGSQIWLFAKEVPNPRIQRISKNILTHPPIRWRLTSMQPLQPWKHVVDVYVVCLRILLWLIHPKYGKRVLNTNKPFFVQTSLMGELSYSIFGFGAGPVAN